MSLVSDSAALSKYIHIENVIAMFILLLLHQNTLLRMRAMVYLIMILPVSGLSSLFPPHCNSLDFTPSQLFPDLSSTNTHEIIV